MIVCLSLVLAVPAKSFIDSPRETKMAAYTETIPGAGIKFEMVPVPGGTFIMGSPLEEPGRSADEGPQRRVAIRPFWMGRLEVTWDEYDAFAFGRGVSKPNQPADTQTSKQADAVTRPTPPYSDESFGFGKGGQPVISITHHAAMEYCRWLSEKTGKTYRLPTEAEWEYACRAGTASAYSFGDDWNRLGEYAWNLDNSDGRPHPGGQKRPNTWGLYDMHGNVAEWCLDHYGENRYSSLKQDAVLLSPVLLPTERRYPHVAQQGCSEAPRVALQTNRGASETRKALRAYGGTPRR
jgi:formylglycine-generating enzyme required for sulfatase activity